jgi:hypothetical protein
LLAGGDSYRGQGSGGGVGWAGGGGGGFYGGGGGGNVEFWLEGGGGGGGAGSVDPGAWADTASVGVQANDGLVILSYAKSQPAAPTISSLSPWVGVPGATVSIVGTNLAGATSVRFGGIPATSFSVASAARIDAIVPAEAWDGPVAVTTKGGKARSPGGFTLSHVQPDAAIRAPGSVTFVGGDIYGTTGLRQTVTAGAKRGWVQVFRIRFQNDGDQVDSVLVGGPAGAAPFRLRYLAGSSGTTVVTADVTTGNYLLADVAPGAVKTLRLEVTVGGNATVGATRAWIVTATSVTDAARRDAVKALVKVLRSQTAGASGIGWLARDQPLVDEPLGPEGLRLERLGRGTPWATRALIWSSCFVNGGRTGWVPPKINPV